MEAIRKITKIVGNTLQLTDLESFNNQTVEVIIFPVSAKTKLEKTKTKGTAKTTKPSLQKLKGIWKDREIDLKSIRKEAWPERKK